MWAPLITPQDWIFLGAAFALGACIGSFLNVVIYRLPLGLSVNEPKRSFCPHCKAPIRARHNLPIFGWLLLGGKCADCRQPVSVRYPAVELLTGVLFALVWLQAWPVQPWLALPWMVFVAILIAATFIDIDHLIIPDELTWGGTAAGIVFATIFPQLVGEKIWHQGLLWSGLAAAAGFALLWLILQAGKLAFGKRHLEFPEPLPFHWRMIAEDEAEFVLGDEQPEKWSEFFGRESDRLDLVCAEVEINGTPRTDVTVHAFYNRLELPGANYPLLMVESFSGRVRAAVVPREAMGWGDLKFLAAIGAFLGWKATLFSVGAGAVVGSVVGLMSLSLKRWAPGLQLPFGPFLALGALLWLFAGQAVLDWYFALLQSRYE